MFYVHNEVGVTTLRICGLPTDFDINKHQVDITLLKDGQALYSIG